MKNEVNTKIILGIITAVFAVFVIWFIFMSNTAESKYGKAAVDDAKAAIFTADQYLDGKITIKEYDRQVKHYEKDVDLSSEESIIYTYIGLMSAQSTDARILQYRNELADVIGEKKR